MHDRVCKKITSVLFTILLHCFGKLCMHETAASTFFSTNVRGNLQCWNCEFGNN